MKPQQTVTGRAAMLAAVGPRQFFLRVTVSPVAKGRARTVRTKTGASRTYTPARTWDAENLLALAFKEQHRSWVPWPKGVALALEVTVYLKPPKRAKEYPTGRPDADNFLKMLDALNGLAWADDSQIVMATVRKWYADDSGERPVGWVIRARELSR